MKKITIPILLSLLACTGISLAYNVKGQVVYSESNDNDNFYSQLKKNYEKPLEDYNTEVRWWLPEGSLSDQTIKEEIHAMHEAGFSGVEICQQSESGVSDQIYAYGTEQWNHDFKLILNEALDLGMKVGITSGTNWNTTNVPGLNPDSQSAMQGLATSYRIVNPGQSISGKITDWENYADDIIKSRVAFSSVPYTNRVVGAYAYKISNKETQTRNQAINDMGVLEEQTTNMYRIVDGNSINISDKITGSSSEGYTLDWTAPNDGSYAIVFYWQAGTRQSSSPSAKPSYCVNYFDKSGVQAFKEYFNANMLDDEELNKKIKAGNVQLFMDSLEINLNGCSTYWPENFKEEFLNRKGYDIMPYLYMCVGLPSEGELTRWEPGRTDFGVFNAETNEKGLKILNDIRDVQTELYMENYMNPMREYLKEYGIKLRAQISYGRHIEISQPIMSVDYPEMENLNQRNQVDIYRLWTGGSKLQNKVLSSETGALGMYGYAFDRQKHLQEAYSVYAAGGSRINWHIWQSSWANENVIGVRWPGYQSLAVANFNTLGTREIAFDTYNEMNTHLARVQELLREGKSRTDVGMIYTKYDQQLVCTMEDSSNDMWMQRHDSMLFPSTELQEKGYTYDYFNPEFINADGVYFDETNKTLELAGYKALVLWQEVLDCNSANDILKLAQKGMKVVIIDGAATKTPFNSENDDELASIMSSLKSQSSVRTVSSADDVYETLVSLGVYAYAGFEKSNYQLLSQVRGDDNGNRYLYLYNYCDGTLHDDANDPNHGTHTSENIVMDGTFIPYYIDSFSGEVNQLSEYTWKDGKTIINVELDYGNIGLYAFESVNNESIHVTSSSGGGIYTSNNSNISLKASSSGTYVTTLSDENVYTNTITVPNEIEIKDWYLTVTSLTASKKKDTRVDTYTDSLGTVTTEKKFKTEETEIKVKLESMTTWDKIEKVGKTVSGKGYYVSTFNWDGSASGAILDLGNIVNGVQVYINGQKTSDVDVMAGTVDISNLLMKGSNKIEIKYSSNYNNVLIANGRLSIGNSGWHGYRVDYRSYGPSQAIIKPYNVVDVKTGEISYPTLTDAPEWNLSFEGFDDNNGPVKEKSTNNILWISLVACSGIIILSIGLAGYLFIKKRKTN